MKEMNAVTDTGNTWRRCDSYTGKNDLL